MMSQFKLGRYLLDLSKPQIMGILNVTTDSFSDGGKYLHLDAAKQQAEQMIEQGASIIDIGAESTRPGAEPVSLDMELERVIPLIEHLVQFNIPLSIDTNKAQVMKAAVEAGASMINDVCALQTEDALATAANLNVPICLMHMQGTPQTMQQRPGYQNVIEEVIDFFKARIQACKEVGIIEQQLILDPGFGFGKTLDHNLTLLKHLDEFKNLKLPILVGISRKSMLGDIINKPPEQRISASVASAIIAWQKGASFIRVHDVSETKDALDVVTSIEIH